MNQIDIDDRPITRSPSNNNLKTLMLFELSCGGHYPEYINHLVSYWSKHSLQESLIIVVSPQFLQRHQEVVRLAEKDPAKSIDFLSITSEEAQQLIVANNPLKRIIRAFQEFKLVAKYARLVKANHILFTYFDTRQLPLALGQKLPCPCSGIYFRPRFHYSDLAQEEIGWQEKLVRWKEKLLLVQALKYSQLKYIFSLDPFVVKNLGHFSTQAQAIALPDPVEINSELIIDREKLSAKLDIEPQRKVFLLFGGLTKRKGIIPLLDALALLPPEVSQKICLLLVGSISPQLKQQIQPKIIAVTQENSVQIISEYRYITESETHQYFQLSDVILALYQRHIGMSGIIMRAAATQKPVLSSNYGLMGEITRRYQLGIALDSTKPQEIAEGLKQLLTKSPTEFIDCDRAAQLTQQNSPVNFASTIFQHLSLTQ